MGSWGSMMASGLAVRPPSGAKWSVGNLACSNTVVKTFTGGDTGCHAGGTHSTGSIWSTEKHAQGTMDWVVLNPFVNWRKAMKEGEGLSVFHQFKVQVKGPPRQQDLKENLIPDSRES